MITENWHLIVCGINHKSSTLANRQFLQLAKDDLAKAYSIFGNIPGVMESVILATCNRIEFYFIAGSNKEPFGIVRDFFDGFKNIDISAYSENFYIKKEKHAAAHLFRVAAGIDSMVIGENQVMRQLKDAYGSACSMKTAGKILHRLFHQAFRTGKQVRSDTEIGAGACSVSSVAIEILKSKIGRLDDCTVLLIGANQIIALAASGLKNLGVGKFLFANRTLEKAESLAAKYGGSAHPLDNLEELIDRADAVISCTSASLPIITLATIENLETSRSSHNLVMIDLAVTRDIEIDREAHRNIDLHDLDDVYKFIKSRREKRELAIPEAELVIDRRLGEFMYWYDHMGQEPIYNGLNETHEALFQQEMAPSLNKLSPDLRRELEHATRRLIGKLLQLQTADSKSSLSREI